MFEPPGTPTFLGLTAGEWEAVGTGGWAALKATSMESTDDCPAEYAAEKHYYRGAAALAWLLKICLRILAQWIAWRMARDQPDEVPSDLPDAEYLQRLVTSIPAAQTRCSMKGAIVIGQIPGTGTLIVQGESSGNINAMTQKVLDYLYADEPTEAALAWQKKYG